MIIINNDLIKLLNLNNKIYLLNYIQKININYIYYILFNNNFNNIFNNNICYKKKRIFNLKNNRIQFDNLKNYRNNLTTIPKLPNVIDLRYKFPPAYDQEDLGSCTANAICSLIYFEYNCFLGSRLFLYYNERLLNKSIDLDSGASLSDGIKVLMIYGICLEKDWLYDITKFKIKPPLKCYSNALKNKAVFVSNIRNDLQSMKNAIYNNDPFVVGIAIFESFESSVVTKTGYVPMPKINDKYLGGHAVLCIGYDDIKKVFIMRNSWGPYWGDNGNFYLPYNYLLNSSYTSDLWCIKRMN